jgi:hypothetical protein
VELPKVEPLNIDRSALQLLGNSLSKSLAVDLKNNRGRKTLSLHTFSQTTSMAASPTEDHRFIKDSGIHISSQLFYVEKNFMFRHLNLLNRKCKYFFFLWQE